MVVTVLPTNELVSIESLRRNCIEWLKCKRSLMYYLTHYVYIQDRISQAVIPWSPQWEHLLELVEIVQGWRDAVPREPVYVVIFKSRQVGASTLLGAITNWLAEFHSSTKVELQSEKGDVAAEMLQRSRFINESHPDFLKLTCRPDTEMEIGFPATLSKITAMPSTPSAGRTSDATAVFCDEWDYHPYAEDGFSAVRPAMARGGLFIGLSTIDKSNFDTFMKKVYNDAEKGANGFIHLFWSYFVVPGRDERTYARDTAGMAPWRKEGEYPRDRRELMAAPPTQGYFNHDILLQMLDECLDPIEVRYGGIMRIWKRPVTQRKFILSVDSSEGRDDPCACIIADAQTDEDVACFGGKISLDEQAKYAFELYKEYNEPLVIVERNASGLTLIEKLSNLGVKNWYYLDAQKSKPGFYTGSRGTANRNQILAEYAEEVHLRRKRIPIKDIVLQHFDFAWLGEPAKPQAVRGKHDDWVMCEAILNQGKRQVNDGVRLSTSNSIDRLRRGRRVRL